MAKGTIYKKVWTKIIAVSSYAQDLTYQYKLVKSEIDQCNEKHFPVPRELKLLKLHLRETLDKILASYKKDPDAWLLQQMAA